MMGVYRGVPGVKVAIEKQPNFPIPTSDPGTPRHTTPSEALTMALRGALENGHRPPCTRRDQWRWWTSEAVEERDAAAAQCRPCTIVDECHAAAEHQGEKWGVWAAVDRDPKRKKRKATP